MISDIQKLIAEMQGDGRLTVLLYIGIGLVAVRWLLSHRAASKRDVDRAVRSVPPEWQDDFRSELAGLRVMGRYCNSAGVMNVKGLFEAKRDFLIASRRELARQRAVRRQDKAFRR